MSSSIHGRDQIDYVKVGAKRDGTITGLECTAIADFGAYFTLLTPFIPSFTGFVISGCYKIPNRQFTAKGVFTNKMATDATRGAGRPEATHLIEVMVEQLAAELGMDPLELRRKNFIPKEDFPAEVAIGIVYDSGDYHGSLDKLLTHVDVDAFRARAGGAAERRASTAASASPPGWRSAASRRRAWSARAASASRRASTSPRSCACTRRAR